MVFRGPQVRLGEVISKIIGWLGGGAITAIGGQINEWQRIRAAAQNDHERLEADKMLATLEASKATILQAQRDKYERWVRIGFAAPFVIYNAKLVLWDKVFGLGATDPLSPELANIQMTIIASYFIYATVTGLRR